MISNQESHIFFVLNYYRKDTSSLHYSSINAQPGWHAFIDMPFMVLNDGPNDRTSKVSNISEVVQRYV